MQFPANPNLLRPSVQGEKWPKRIHWVSVFLLVCRIPVHAGRCGCTVGMPDGRKPCCCCWQPSARWPHFARCRLVIPEIVLLAAGIVAFIGGVMHAVGAKSGLPFGPFMFGAAAGEKLFNILPWFMPLLWVVIVLNSRGVGRLILRPWRKTRTYGFWLIGVTALLTILFDCALEPFAAHVKHYWVWTAGGISLTPHGAPITNSVGWFVVTLLMLAFATPTLINKQLSRRSTPDFHPLIIWLGGIVLFATGSAMNGLWAAGIVDGVIAILVAVFTIRGARW